jgi:hypothetical protein
MRKINIQSNSEVFLEFIQKVDKILAGTEITDAAGNPTEYADPHFQDRLQRLQQCSFDFEERAMYPLTGEIVRNLIYDEIKCKEDQNDLRLR